MEYLTEEYINQHYFPVRSKENEYRWKSPYFQCGRCKNWLNILETRRPICVECIAREAEVNSTYPYPCLPSFLCVQCNNPRKKEYKKFCSRECAGLALTLEHQKRTLDINVEKNS